MPKHSHNLPVETETQKKLRQLALARETFRQGETSSFGFSSRRAVEHQALVAPPDIEQAALVARPQVEPPDIEQAALVARPQPETVPKLPPVGVTALQKEKAEQKRSEVKKTLEPGIAFLWEEIDKASAPGDAYAELVVEAVQIYRSLSRRGPWAVPDILRGEGVLEKALRGQGPRTPRGLGKAFTKAFRERSLGEQILYGIITDPFLLANVPKLVALAARALRKFGRGVERVVEKLPATEVFAGLDEPIGKGGVARIRMDDQLKLQQAQRAAQEQRIAGSTQIRQHIKAAVTGQPEGAINVADSGMGAQLSERGSIVPPGKQPPFSMEDPLKLAEAMKEIPVSTGDELLASFKASPKSVQDAAIAAAADDLFEVLGPLGGGKRPFFAYEKNLPGQNVERGFRLLGSSQFRLNSTKEQAENFAREFGIRNKINSGFKEDFGSKVRDALIRTGKFKKASPDPITASKTVVDRLGPTKTVYHGSPRVFEKFDPGKFNDNALYGPGAYFTENPSVASGYAKPRVGAEASNVTPAKLQMSKVLDMEESLHPTILKRFAKFTREPHMEGKLIDALDYVLRPKQAGITLEDMLARINTNKQAYRVLTRMFGDKSEVNDWLVANGFDGITHIGGQRRGNPHRVWIALGDDAGNVEHQIQPLVGGRVADRLEPPAQPAARRFTGVPADDEDIARGKALERRKQVSQLALDDQLKLQQAQRAAQEQRIADRVVELPPALEQARATWLKTVKGKRYEELQGLHGIRRPEETIELRKLEQEFLELGMSPKERRAWRAQKAADDKAEAAAERLEDLADEFGDVPEEVVPPQRPRGPRVPVEPSTGTRVGKFRLFETTDPEAYVAAAEGGADQALLGPVRRFKLWDDVDKAPLVAIAARRFPAGKDLFEIEVRGLSTGGKPLSFDDPALANAFSQSEISEIGLALAAKLGAKAFTGSRAKGSRIFEIPVSRFRKRATPGGPGGPVEPSTGGQPPDTPVSRVMRMWEEPIKPEPVGLKQRGTEAYVKLQELTTDRWAWGNRQAGIARREYQKTTGKRLPPELDFQMQASFLGAADAAGYQRFADTQLKALRELGEGINRDYVETYLHFQHGKSIVEVKGPQRLIAGGIKGVDEAEAGLRGLSETLGPERFARVEKAAIQWRNAARAELALDVVNGRIAAELADRLQEMYPWYLPIKYQEVLLKHAEGLGGRAISLTRNDIRGLSDVGSEAKRQRPTASLLQHMMLGEVGRQRNRTAKALIENMRLDPALKDQIKRVSGVRSVAQVEGEAVFRRPAGEIRGTISTMTKGKRVVWEVPAEAERMAKRIAESPLEDVYGFLNALQMPFRHAFVTYQPSFIAAQGFFDMVVVASTRGTMPWNVGMAFLRNIKGLFRHDPFMAEIYKSGGAVTAWHGRSARALAKNYEKSGNVITYTPTTVEKALTRPWEFLRDLGHAVEISSRRAVAEQVLRKGGTQAEAAFAFRRSTVDFNQSGTAMRLANSLFLFLNPSVQGTLLPLRALRDVRVAKYGIAGLMGWTMANYAWNRQFPEYADVPLYHKYGGMVWMLPSNTVDRRGQKEPRYIMMPPMLRELGFFTAPPIYLLGKMDGQSPESTEQFLNAMVRQLNPVSSIIGGGIPVPTQIGSLLAEIYLNHDSFRDRPIVPTELEHLPAQDQFDERTSEVARRLGKFLDWSPLKIDHLLRQGVTWDIMGMLDVGLRFVFEGEDPHIEGLAERLAEIQENVRAESVQIHRRKFLGSLTAKERAAVLKAERTPDPRIPFGESVLRRFYRKQGGNLYRSGQAAAQKATGISPEQTREAGRVLSGSFEKLQLAQEKSNADLDVRKINHTQWREAHRNLSKLYHGAFSAVQTLLPQAGQAARPDQWQEYKAQVATIGKAMVDRRSRGDVIYSAWRAIVPEEISPTLYNWEPYYERRDDFEASLSKVDKTLLAEWREAFMTPPEKEWERVKETLQPYWDVGRDMQIESPQTQAIWKEYLDASRGEKSQMLDDMPKLLNNLIAVMEGKRLEMRKDRDKPAIGLDLVRWFEFKALNEEQRILHDQLYGQQAVTPQPVTPQPVMDQSTSTAPTVVPGTPTPVTPTPGLRNDVRPYIPLRERFKELVSPK